jgi:hypothetical protein
MASEVFDTHTRAAVHDVLADLWEPFVDSEGDHGLRLRSANDLTTRVLNALARVGREESETDRQSPLVTDLGHQVIVPGGASTRKGEGRSGSTEAEGATAAEVWTPPGTSETDRAVREAKRVLDESARGQGNNDGDK